MQLLATSALLCAYNIKFRRSDILFLKESELFRIEILSGFFFEFSYYQLQKFTHGGLVGKSWS